MVVIHRAHGFRFVIYVHDHEPAHVHVHGPGRAKVQLSGLYGLPELVEAKEMKASDLRRLMREVDKQQLQFQSEWDRINGPKS
jgi:hypothetical protein